MSWRFHPELSYPCIAILATLKSSSKRAEQKLQNKVGCQVANRPRPTTEPIPETSIWTFDDDEDKKRDEQNIELAEAMEGRFVGPMPVKAFLDEFLPVTDEGKKCPETKDAFAAVTSSEVKHEIKMYDPFVRSPFILDSIFPTEAFFVDRGCNAVRTRHDILQDPFQSRHKCGQPCSRRLRIP